MGRRLHDSGPGAYMTADPGYVLRRPSYDVNTQGVVYGGDQGLELR